MTDVQEPSVPAQIAHGCASMLFVGVVIFILPIIIIAWIIHLIYGTGLIVSIIGAVPMSFLVWGVGDLVFDLFIPSKKERKRHWHRHEVAGRCPKCREDLSHQDNPNWCASCGWNTACPECGFDIRRESMRGCPECGWGRGAA